MTHDSIPLPTELSKKVSQLADDAQANPYVLYAEGWTDDERALGFQLMRARQSVKGMGALYDEVNEERKRYRDVLEQIDAHYGGSLDHQPPYVAAAREALTDA